MEVRDPEPVRRAETVASVRVKPVPARVPVRTVAFKIETPSTVCVVPPRSSTVVTPVSSRLPEASEPLEPTSREPAVTMVFAVEVFAPDRMSEPSPDLVRAKLPSIAPSVAEA